MRNSGKSAGRQGKVSWPQVGASDWPLDQLPRAPSSTAISTLWVQWAPVAASVAVVLFVVWFGSLAAANHSAWLTRGYDLGNADQALWNTAHGRPLQFTNWVGKDNWFREPTRLGMHVEPIYFLLAPLYWVFPDVRALLWLQAIAVALGAIPAYRLARRHLHAEIAGLVFALAYLLSSAAHWLVLSDFHAVALAAPLLLAAFDALEQKRNGRFLVFAVLAMMTKENIPLAIAGMGAWAWLAQGRRRFGAAVAGFALAWFVVAVFVVIPEYSLAGQSPFLGNYNHLAQDGKLASLLDGLRRAPILPYLFDFLLPLAGLPLLSPAALLPALPDLAINLLSGNPLMSAFGRQYVAVLLPIGIAAAIFGMGALWRWAQRRWPERIVSIQVASLGVLLLCSLLGAASLPVTPLAPGFVWPEVTQHKARLAAIASHIPADASLCVQDNLNPHFSQRQEIFLLPYTTDCDYLLLDVVTAPFLADNRAGQHTAWRQRLTEEGRFGVVAADDGIALFKRGAPVQPLPPSFYTFVRPAQHDPDVVRTGRFGQDIELTGYSVEPRAGQPPAVRAFFRALQPIARDYSLRLYLIEEPGRVLAASEQPQSTLVWLPTSAWQPGEMVEVLANTTDWHVPLQPGRQYSLALAWDDGSDAWNAGTRLPFAEGDGDAAPRRLQDDTLVLVAAFDASGAVSAIRRQDALAPDMQRVDAHMGNGADLVGFKFESEHGAGVVRPGETLRVRLVWQVNQASPTDYQVFVHLLDETGVVVAQGDGPPVGGSWPTSDWRAGDQVQDMHELKLDPALPAGEYTLAVGLYDAVDGQRVPVSGQDVDGELQRIVLPLKVRVSAPD